MRIKPVDTLVWRRRGPYLRGHEQLMTAGGEALSFCSCFSGYGMVKYTAVDGPVPRHT